MTDLEDLNHYERLGVLEDASPEEIKAAHRARIKEFHPDNRPIAYRVTFDQMMKEINAAHDVLKDPRKRAAYNRKLAGERLDTKRRAQEEQRARDQRRQRDEEARRAREAEQERREAEERRRAEAEQERAAEERRRQEEYRRREQGDGWDPERTAAAYMPATSSGEKIAAALQWPVALAHRLPFGVHLVCATLLCALAWLVGSLALLQYRMALVGALLFFGLPVVAFFIYRYSESDNVKLAAGVLLAGPVLTFVSSFVPFVNDVLRYGSVVAAAWAVLWLYVLVMALGRWAFGR
jgi:hypothetical protein